MTEKIKKIRDPKIDFIKGFAIFLVVWGHAIQYLNNGEFDFFKHPVFIFIYSFHMPLFMFISGYLFSYSLNRMNNPIDIIKYRFKRLVIPIISWGLLISILKIIIKILVGRDINIISELYSYIKLIPYSSWFLWGLFYCSIIVIIGNKFFKDSIFFYIFCCVIMLFIPDYLASNLYKFVYPYFVIGYFINDIKDIIIKYSKYIKIVSFSLFPLLLLLWKKDYYIYISGTYLFNEYYPHQLENVLYRYGIGLIGIIVILFLIELYFKFINKNKINNILCILGKYSLGIYIITGYMFDLLNRITVPFVNNMYIYSFIVTPIVSMVMVYISVIISKKIQSNKLLNTLLFGGK